MESHLGSILLGAKVGTAAVLPYCDELDAADHVGLDERRVSERRDNNPALAQAGKGIEPPSEPEVA